MAGGRDLDLPGDRIRLRATRWSGAGPAVLLLHGLASQRRFWNLVVAHLAGLPVVALDQRGHGESDVPDSGYDTDTVVRDVLVALDALGLSRVVVVGHSWGAVVALTLAAQHPSRVLSVIALDGGLSSPAERWSRAEARSALAPPRIEVEPSELVDLLRGGDLAPWWSTDVEDAVLPIFGVGDDGLARARLPRERHLDVVDALYDYAPGDLLPRVHAPAWLAVCVEAGTRSEWSEQKLAALKRACSLVPRVRAITLAGAVHDVPLQWPALVAGLVRAAVEDAGAGTEGDG